MMFLSKNFLKVCLACLPILAFSLFSQAQQAPVLGSVNGSKIYAKQLDEWVKNAIAGGATDSPEMRQSILNELVVREAVLQDAKKSGLTSKPDNEFKIKIASQNAVMDLWFAEYFQKHPLTENDLKAEYDKQVELTKSGRNSNEYRVSQILLADEKDAERAIIQINSGAQFENIAKEKSLDKTSAANGGAVNWALPDQLMSPIGDVVMNLQKGKINNKPIKTQIGWHVIRLDDVRPYKIPSFEDAKQSLAQALIQKKKQEAIADLMKRTQVVQGK